MPLFHLGGTYNGHNEDPPFGCIELHFEVPYWVSCVICSCHDLVFRPNENTVVRLLLVSLCNMLYFRNPFWLPGARAPVRENKF